jgi:hypothetical protein
MRFTPSIEVAITVPATAHSQIILGRVASRNLTHVKQVRNDMHDLQSQTMYRSNMLHLLRSTCRNLEDGDRLVQNFRDLVENLERKGAVAIPTEHQPDISGNPTLDGMWQAVLNGEDAYQGRWLPTHCGPRELCTIIDHLLHPLLIALLAYQMGGPINAAKSAHAHQWRRPTDPIDPQDTQNFYMESEHGGVFDIHRLTFVWEQHSEESRGPSGSHHIFLNGNGIHSNLLKTASCITSQISTPVAILYNSKTSAIFYDCQESDAVRNSISLDFHIETTSNDVLALLENPDRTDIDISSRSLNDLILEFPVRQYGNHFHDRLFSDASLQAILDKLAAIDISPASPSPQLPQQVSLRRMEAYESENRSRRPLNIDMEHDVRVSGPYPSIAYFVRSLTLKSRRDMHLGLGWDLFPRNTIDENRERARKYLRDMPVELLHRRLELYAEVLLPTTYTACDLLSTEQLQVLSRVIENRCNELIGNGYVDPDLVLNSMAPFAAALGKALNGPKEFQRGMDACADELSCQYYRTRCLYLFWCADWLVNHHNRITPGPFMLFSMNETEMVKSKQEIASVARVLLRNWVAWGLVVEKFTSHFRFTRNM